VYELIGRPFVFALMQQLFDRVDECRSGAFAETLAIPRLLFVVTEPMKLE